MSKALTARQARIDVRQENPDRPLAEWRGLRVGDKVHFYFAGGPTGMPEPWTIVKMEEVFSSVGYEYYPSVTIRAANGKEQTFDHAERYSPVKYEEYHPHKELEPEEYHGHPTSALSSRQVRGCFGIRGSVQEADTQLVEAEAQLKEVIALVLEADKALQDGYADNADGRLASVVDVRNSLEQARIFLDEAIKQSGFVGNR